MKTKLIGCLLVCLYLMSCATLFKGTHEQVNINSEPQNADVYINGVFKGETPISIKLESKETYTIEYKKKGYKTEVRNITNHVGAGWVVLDVIGGLVPVIVDAATGSWYYLDQKNVNALLEKQQNRTS